jgi:hypothetical protein
MWLSALLGGLVSVAGTLVGKVLLSLGIGFAVYTGVDTSIAWASSTFVSGMSGIPLIAYKVAGLLKVGVCVSMMTSALTTRLVMGGLTSGSITKMVQK